MALTVTYTTNGKDQLTVTYPHEKHRVTDDNELIVEELSPTTHEPNGITHTYSVDAWLGTRESVE